MRWVSCILALNFHGLYTKGFFHRLMLAYQISRGISANIASEGGVYKPYHSYSRCLIIVCVLSKGPEWNFFEGLPERNSLSSHSGDIRIFADVIKNLGKILKIYSLMRIH